MKRAFNTSICEPLNSNIIEKGTVVEAEIMSLLEAFPWKKYLGELAQAEKQGQEIYYSPSFEVENRKEQQGVLISAVGSPDDFEFYVFYKRIKGTDTEQVDDLTGQTAVAVRKYVEAFLKGDQVYLEQAFEAKKQPNPVIKTETVVSPSKKPSFFERLKQFFS